jgi:hypothetical protein
MIYGLELPIFLGRVFLVLAALGATAFPLLYMSVGWFHSLMGRVVMSQALIIAFAIDLKLVLTFFLDPRTRPVLLWCNVTIMAGVAITSSLLCYILIKIRWENRRKRSK